MKNWSQMDVIMKKLVINTPTIVKIPMKITGEFLADEVDGGNSLTGKFLNAMVTTPDGRSILVIP